MEPAAYRALHQLEDHHWWCVGMRRLAWAMLQGALLPPDAPRALDVGCGAGAWLAELTSRHPAVGVDVSPLALHYCQERSLPGLAEVGVPPSKNGYR